MFNRGSRAEKAPTANKCYNNVTFFSVRGNNTSSLFARIDQPRRNRWLDMLRDMRRELGTPQ